MDFDPTYLTTLRTKKIFDDDAADNGDVYIRIWEFFFAHAFLTADGSVVRTVLLVNLQALNTMLAIYKPAAPGCAAERAKSKPASSKAAGSLL